MLYETLLDNCDDLVIGLHSNGNVFELNLIAESICGLRRAEIIGLNLFLICNKLGIQLSFHFDDLKKIAHQKATRLEGYIINQKNQKSVLYFKFVRFLNEKKKVCYFIIGREITELDESPISSLTNQMYLQSIIENLPEYVYWKDKNYLYQGCNNHVAELLKLDSPGSIIGKSDNDFGWDQENIKLTVDPSC
ncbi:MAG: hypothetical protein Q8R83_00910 [Legionellaceae bacterium]|nr:hypothetical protein [Legionellaceae bacterium]